MTKIIEFLKRFWWIFLAPIGFFLVSNLTKRDSSEINKKIKEKKKEIKKTKSKIKDQKVKVEKTKDDLEKSIKKTEDVIKTNLDNKKERDNEAKKFFTYM